MTKEQLERILFVDIETASTHSSFDELSENMQEYWSKKCKTFRGLQEENLDLAQLFEEKAGIFSEFSKVICISVGSFVWVENGWVFRLKSIKDQDEKVLLNNFSELVNRFFSKQKEACFCGHNIKEFDLPFICRRMIIHQIELPKSLQLSQKKPWEINHIDTLELWKFGDYKNYTALGLLAEILDIPSPKNDLDGSKVGKVYWQDNDIERIAQYCMQDVHTTALVYLRLSGQAHIQVPIHYV